MAAACHLEVCIPYAARKEVAKLIASIRNMASLASISKTASVRLVG
jgi:hypothetical protein